MDLLILPAEVARRDTVSFVALFIKIMQKVRNLPSLEVHVVIEMQVNYLFPTDIHNNFA
jgi:hypothetical protein